MQSRDNKTLQTDLGGMLRFNYLYPTWEDARDHRKGGIFEFDTAAMGLEAEYGRLNFSSEYRFYAGYQMLHHGWFGLDLSDNFELRIGVQKVPFGLLPFASHNWFFSILYYTGFEDDYDSGLRLSYEQGPLDIDAAYFASDEGHYTGKSFDSARYSYDVVEVQGASNPFDFESSKSEAHQGNIRGALTIEHAEQYQSEFGISGQVGMLTDRYLDESEVYYGFAGHIEGTYSAFELQLETVRYVYASDPGLDFVVMGAYDEPYKVARESTIFVGNLAYELPWPSDSLLQTLTLYNDFSYMVKDVPAYPDSLQNVIGAKFDFGPLLIYADIASGKNHPWLGPDYSTALAEAENTEGWNVRYNLNMGFYF